MSIMHTEYLSTSIKNFSQFQNSVMHISNNKFTFTANKDDVIFTSEIISVIPLAMEVRKLTIIALQEQKKSESMIYLNSINF